MASDLYQRVSLREDLYEMCKDCPQLGSLYMNLLDHILRKAGINNQYTHNPEKIKISNISMTHDGICQIQVDYHAGL